MYKTIRISEFLHRKRVHQPIKHNMEYSLVTVKLHHKGVILREKKLGSLIKSNMCRVSKGDFILSGIDARNGAFGIVPEELDGAVVTNDFWYFEIDEKIIKRDFFYWLTTTPLFLDACIKSSRGETQRIRLQKELFFNFELNLPPIEEQEIFLNRFQVVDELGANLRNELDEQSTYLTQLRQTILQEAIEGKLTAQWRAQHPTQAGNPDYDAVALLAQIKAEKQKLIAEKKIGKENPLPPIREEEMPFDLPEGWVWCRLGEVVKSMTNGLYKPAGYYSDNGIISLRMFNIQEGSIILEGAKRLRVTPDEMNTYLLEQGDILINRVNSKELVGKAALIRETQEDMVFESMNIRVRFLVSIHLPDYVNLLFRSLYIQNICYGLAKQAIGQASINQSQLAKIEIPLPPLAEQRAIVERVDRLLAMVDELAAQVAERKSQADALMQAVLREAFQPTPP